MKQSFPIKHWLFTLIIGPLFTPLYNYFFLPDKNLISGLLELYPIALVFSVILSLPALFLEYLVFWSLKKKGVNIKVSKLILIAFAVSTIVFTTISMKGSQSKEILFTYSIATIISGCLLRLTENNSAETILI